MWMASAITSENPDLAVDDLFGGSATMRSYRGSTGLRDCHCCVSSKSMTTRVPSGLRVPVGYSSSFASSGSQPALASLFGTGASDQIVGSIEFGIPCS